MSEEVARVLDRAREIIVKYGWWQGDLFGPNGEVCAVGAIGLAVSFPAPLIRLAPTERAACQALARATGADSIDYWNDAPDRTRRQVLLAFHRAAKAERQS